MANEPIQDNNQFHFIKSSALIQGSGFRYP